MALPEKNFQAVQQAIRDLLIAVGEDPDRNGLKDTPKRVAKMYSEILDGNFADLPAEKLTRFEQEEYGGIILVRRVPFYAFCEHHLALFHGTFTMGYVPNNEILGLSKLVRVFRHGCKRPTIQERITQEAVARMMKLVNPKGAICYVDAEHTCMTLRGVKSPGSTTVTIAEQGIFTTDERMRQLFVNEASRT